MGFFGWFLVTIFTIWLTFRLFGKRIMKFVLTFVAKRMTKAMEKQMQDHINRENSDPYHDSIHVNNEMEVNIPKNTKTDSTPALEDVAEDIDFEEVRE